LSLYLYFFLTYSSVLQMPFIVQSAKSGGAGPDLVKLEQEEVSAQQQQRLQQIDQRSAKQDDLVSAIDEGVTRLAAIALAMGDEVGGASKEEE
jgi:hypothetical protein